MNSIRKILSKCFFLCVLVTNTLLFSYAQAPVKLYRIKDGSMHITLSKKITPASLDSFISKYSLADLDLIKFIKTGNTDSLNKLGWLVSEIEHDVVSISKPLAGSDNLSNPANKIILTQKEMLAARFAPIGNGITFGFNRFKNTTSFIEQDAYVTVFLSGYLNAKEILLAGSFTNWQQNAIAMKKTDSGWLATIPLTAGKYWYKFIVDGNWITDKANLNTENDGEGNDNSVFYKTNHVFKLRDLNKAKKIIVAGSFNNWNEKALKMQWKDSAWQLPVYIAEGTYTYRFIADGKWLTDPDNTEKLPNEFNEYNSVLRIGLPYVFKLDGYTNAKKIVLMGSFNSWKDNELFMAKTATGWQLPYTLGPGNYQYRLKIDDQLTADSITGENLSLVINANYRFTLKGYANAKAVYAAGTFNNWNPAIFKMKREGDEWVYDVHLSNGKHLYKFIVDGNWILDPANKLWENNEHNTGNSIIWITGVKN
jgi:hypothetical protein